MVSPKFQSVEKIRAPKRYFTGSSLPRQSVPRRASLEGFQTCFCSRRRAPVAAQPVAENVWGGRLPALWRQSCWDRNKLPGNARVLFGWRSCRRPRSRVQFLQQLRTVIAFSFGLQHCSQPEDQSPAKAAVTVGGVDEVSLSAGLRNAPHTFAVAAGRSRTPSVEAPSVLSNHPCEVSGVMKTRESARRQRENGVQSKTNGKATE
jgi:hypothetical protein